MLLDFNWSFGCTWEINIYGSVFGTLSSEGDVIKNLNQWQAKFCRFIGAAGHSLLVCLSWCELNVHLKELDLGFGPSSPLAVTKDTSNWVHQPRPQCSLSWLRLLLQAPQSSLTSYFPSTVGSWNFPVPSLPVHCLWGPLGPTAFLCCTIERLASSCPSFHLTLTLSLSCLLQTWLLVVGQEASCGHPASDCSQESLAVVAPSVVSWSSPASSPFHLPCVRALCVCVCAPAQTRILARSDSLPFSALLLGLVGTTKEEVLSRCTCVFCPSAFGYTGACKGEHCTGLPSLRAFPSPPLGIFPPFPCWVRFALFLLLFIMNHPVSPLLLLWGAFIKQLLYAEHRVGAVA